MATVLVEEGMFMNIKTLGNIKNDFSGASFNLCFVLIRRSCSISWNICSLELESSRMSSIETRAEPCFIRVLEKEHICFVKKFGSRSSP